ncbi:MAG: hypothetical protein ACLQVI_23900 [Polyangiaceae bacterium]
MVAARSVRGRALERVVGVAGVGALAFVALCLPQGCGGPTFVTEAGDSGSPTLADASVTDANASDDASPVADGSGTSDSGSAADGADTGASGNIVYVSPTGSDLHTGLSPLLPKRTIVSALAEAATLSGVPQVHVCAGTYSEAKLQVTTDVALTGSYACSGNGAWTRTATYGYPTFDGTNQTTIENADTVSQLATLSVSGTVTSATMIDGFTIEGGTSTIAAMTGVHVLSGSPIISNDEIEGGSGSGNANGSGSYGVIADDTAAPEITACIIDGGSGSGYTGSIGVSLNTTGAVNLHGAIISGGTGTLVPSSGGNFAAIGVHVRASLTASTPLSELVVVGTDSKGVSANSAGVYIDTAGTSAAIVLCDITGGTGTAAALSAGVYVNTSGNSTVTLLDDRIYGGSQAGTPSQTFGVDVIAAGTILVANSMIHAGTVPLASGDLAVGVALAATASPGIVYDTIYTGAAAGAAIALSTGATGAVVTDDILVGSDQSLGSVGVEASVCSGAISALDYTAFANFGALYACSLSDGGAATATSTTELGVELGASATTGDVALQSTCLAPTGCAVVNGCPATGETCLTSLFGSSWSASTDGTASLIPTVAPDGGAVIGDWALNSDAPCQVTQQGTPITSITTDIDGRTRPASGPTMGAVQYTGATVCTP